MQLSSTIGWRVMAEYVRSKNLFLRDCKYFLVLRFFLLCKYDVAFTDFLQNLQCLLLLPTTFQ